MKLLLIYILLLSYSLVDNQAVVAQLFRGQGQGRGQGRGRGGQGQGHGYGGGGQGHGQGHGGGGGGGGPGRIIQKLLDNHDMYKRNVKELDNGVETKTRVKNAASLPEEKVDELTDLLREHVDQMKKGYRVRWWDPLFAEIHDNWKDIDMKVKKIRNGVKVVETAKETGRASSRCPVMLIKEHADVVTKFVEDGRGEASKTHSKPKEC